MHVSPTKHSYAWLPRKSDYQESVTTGQTDGQTDTGQSDPYVPLCFAGDTKSIGYLMVSDNADSFHARWSRLLRAFCSARCLGIRHMLSYLPDGVRQCRQFPRHMVSLTARVLLCQVFRYTPHVVIFTWWCQTMPTVFHARWSRLLRAFCSAKCLGIRHMLSYLPDGIRQCRQFPCQVFRYTPHVVIFTWWCQTMPIVSTPDGFAYCVHSAQPGV